MHQNGLSGTQHNVQIQIPDKPKKTNSRYLRQDKRKRFRSQTGIEAVKGHLKSNFHMTQNYLHVEAGIQITVLMPCVAWNLKKQMATLNEQAARLFRVYLSGLFYLFSWHSYQIK